MSPSSRAGPTPWPRLRERAGVPVATALAMLASVAATNRWESWNAAVHRYHDADPISYRAIAAAAPGLLHRRVAEWHAERFIPNYVVGCLAKLFHLGLTPSFRIACVAVAVVICVVLAELLVRLRVGTPVAVACLAVFILNPYGLRYFFFGVGRIADLVFILGAIVAVRGLALRAPVSLLGGLLLATVARQTALPAALVAGLVVATDPPWGRRLGGRAHKFSLAIGIVVMPILVYVAIRIVAAPFSGPSPSLEAMTILGPASGAQLLDHVERSIIPLFAVSALLAAAGWRAWPQPIRHAWPRFWRLTDPRGGDLGTAIGCLLFGASIALQPLLLRPQWAQASEPRLAVLGLAPLAVGLALVLRELGQRRTAIVSAAAAGSLVALLALGSLHHIFTVTGPADKAQTVALQAAVAVLAAAIILGLGHRRALPPAASR